MCAHAAVSGAESLMKFNSLTWSLSLSRPQRERASERGRRMLCDGGEVVKWTTAVAIETLLATQRCCYSACLSANFRPVVSMNISVDSHFSGTQCAYNKLYILYSRGEGKKNVLNSQAPLKQSTQQSNKSLGMGDIEAYPAEKPFVI